MGELEELIRSRIESGGGWIPLEDFMEAALFEPGLGYYASGLNPLGAGGDFTTAAQESELYARTIAKCVSAAMPDGGSLLEIGGGSGTFLSALASELARGGTEPPLLSLETSPGLQDAQRKSLERAGLADRCNFVDEMPQGFKGVAVASEVLDAQPCEVIARRKNGWVRRGVSVAEAGELCWADGPAADPKDAERVDGLDLPEGYQLEVGHRAERMVADVAGKIDEGTFLIIDYGFPRRELYHPQRAQGTLNSHGRHLAREDVLENPGAQDISFHVDFTAVAESAASAGAKVAGYSPQAAFLLELGISELAEGADSLADRARASHELQMLLMPQEMGELFKVMALTKGDTAPPPGFSLGDRLGTL